MKTKTIALLLILEDPKPILVDILQEEEEILFMERTFSEQISLEDSLQIIQHNRLRNAQKDEEFDDQVENLVCYPFQRPEVIQQGVHWFNSKFKEQENKIRLRFAAEVIAQHALEVFMKEPKQTDFILEGPIAQVRVRIFLFSEIKKSIA